MQSASNITNSNKYEDGVDKATVIDSNVSTLQSYTVSKGTNFALVQDSFKISLLEGRILLLGMGTWRNLWVYNWEQKCDGWLQFKEAPVLQVLIILFLVLT